MAESVALAADALGWAESGIAADALDLLVSSRRTQSPDSSRMPAGFVALQLHTAGMRLRRASPARRLDRDH